MNGPSKAFERGMDAAGAHGQHSIVWIAMLGSKYPSAVYKMSAAQDCLKCVCVGADMNYHDAFVDTPVLPVHNLSAGFVVQVYLRRILR